MDPKKLGIAAASIIAAGAIYVGGAAMASADDSSTTTGTTTSSTTLDSRSAAGSGSSEGSDATGGATGDNGTGGNGARGGPGGGQGRAGQMHQHTEVTGDEATKVTAAVTAKDSSVTVESVRKDPDGSYDVLGTKDGSKVMVEVSSDLQTIEVRTGGDGGPGGQGKAGQMHQHTEVTGDEAAKVKAAVTAKDSAVTVESVRKDADGSYDVLGTKDGSKVMVEVSSDLQTIEVRTGGDGGPGGDHGQGSQGKDQAGATQSGSGTSGATGGSSSTDANC